MAYLDLAMDLPRAAIAAASVAPRHDVISRVTPLEQQVIRLAAVDGRWSLRAPGRVDTLLGWIFGLKPTNHLADTRLESLRRFAVLARLHGDRLPADETDRLLRAGFVREALDEIRQHVRATTRAAA